MTKSLPFIHHLEVAVKRAAENLTHILFLSVFLCTLSVSARLHTLSPHLR